MKKIFLIATLLFTIITTAQQPTRHTNGVVFGAKSTAPATPKSGQVYYNSVNNTLYLYNGTQWQSLGGSPPTLQQTYEGSTPPKIILSNIENPLILQNGTANKNDDVLVIKSTEGSDVFKVSGKGSVRANSIWMNDTITNATTSISTGYIDVRSNNSSSKAISFSDEYVAFADGNSNSTFIKPAQAMSGGINILYLPSKTDTIATLSDITGGGGVTDHTQLTNIGVKTHAQLDTQVDLNNAKVGITPTQASDIVTNNAKISYPGDQDLSGYLLNTTDTFTGDLNIVGKLGINVASPLNTLSLGDGSSQMGWNFETHTNNTGDYGFNLEASGGNPRILSNTNPFGGNRQVIYMGHSNGDKNVFGISDSSDSGVTYNPRFTVNGNGEVGIGINNPVEKLEVVGYTKSTGFKVTTKTDADVVLAGGGTKLLSDFALSNTTETTGESLYPVRVVYRKLDGKVYYASAATSISIDAEILMYTSILPISANQQSNFLRQGIVSGFGNLTIGDAYYLGESSEGHLVNDTSSFAVGSIIRYMGTAISATEIYFNPSNSYTIVQEVKDAKQQLAKTGTVIDLTNYSSEYNAVTPLTSLTYTFTAGDLGSNAVVYIPSGLATYPALSGGVTNASTYPVFDNTKEYKMVINTNSNNVEYFFLER